MLSLFLENLKRLSVFIVISQTILHFGVGRKYEKYIKLILSFMVVAQLVFAISSYFDLESGFMMRGMAKEKYYEQWEQYMVGLEEEYKLQQSSLDQRLEEKYKNNDKNNKGESSGIKVNKIAIP